MMEKKIRVCHICNLGMNGKAIFLCNLLENIDYSKYDITILDYRAECAEPVMNRLEKLPVEIIKPDNKSLRSFMKLLKNYLNSNSVDVIHSHIWDLSGLFLYVARKKGVSIRVCHSHNTSKAPGRYGRIKEFIRDKVLWNILRFMIQTNANRFVACSEEAAKWLYTDKIIDMGKHSIIKYGIDFSTFSPGSNNSSEIEILFAGRFIYQKNPLFAIRVFSEYHKLNPKSHLTMIGKGTMEREIKELIMDLGLQTFVTLIPESSEMQVYYRKSNIFLFPSYYEGFGIVLIEAQACGLKCLTSDNVPASTQCGLVKYLSLELGYKEWACELDSMLHTNMYLDNDALECYNIKECVKQVDKLYGVMS